MTGNAERQIEAEGLLDQHMAEVLAAASAPDDAMARAALAELWAHRRGEVPPEMIELPCAEAVGTAVGERGGGSDEPVRLVLALARALDGVAARAGAIDAASAARLRRIGDEAAARAAAAHARLGRERREAWLAFFSHELKNPLNTVLNALWLLREQRPAAEGARFIDLAERAVRRIEGEIREMRQLHERAAGGEPARQPSGEAAHEVG